jgi:hypothetical protein
MVTAVVLPLGIASGSIEVISGGGAATQTDESNNIDTTRTDSVLIAWRVPCNIARGDLSRIHAVDEGDFMGIGPRKRVDSRLHCSWETG